MSGLSSVSFLKQLVRKSCAVNSVYSMLTSMELFIVSKVVILTITWKGTAMDNNRIKGSIKQAAGAIKEAAGKITGDAKLQADGKAAKTSGKIQNAVGGVKDALRGK